MVCQTFRKHLHWFCFITYLWCCWIVCLSFELGRKMHDLRKDWRYQRAIQKPFTLKDRQNNGQKRKYKMTNTDVQNTTQKTKDRATRFPLKSVCEVRCSGRVSCSCSACGTCHECGKDMIAITTHGRHPWSFVTPIFRWRP